MIRTDPTSWKSHAVIVVATSGSMRQADVWGATSRLSAVRMSVALNYIAHRLEAGEAGSSDVVSILTLSEVPVFVIVEEPWTWHLYNQISRIHSGEWDIPLGGHGPFIPALRNATELLKRKPSSSCALALCILSDGAPSDNIPGHNTEGRLEAICEEVGELAQQFGRRLTFSTIGIGDQENFDVLKKMAEKASDYGAQGSFSRPSMTSSGLGSVFTSVTTSLTTTQAEMTDLATLQQRPVRKILRESKTKAKETILKVSPKDFHIYPIERVKRTVYEEWYDTERVLRRRFKPVPLQHPDAKFVAICKDAFGEGAERFAYRFYELGADAETIIGPAFVAKESRLVLEKEGTDSSVRKEFVRKFCHTQQLARRLSEEFNKMMASTFRIDKATSTVSFLDCSIYELDDVNVGKQSVLVEERLDESKWHKWNANNGYVEGMDTVPKFNEDTIRDCMQKLATVDLGFIEEGDEEDEDEEDEDDDREEDHAEPKQANTVVFNPSQVAQAFSHFTYCATGRNRLVCDLQGVFDPILNVLKLSDPVIHYYNQHATSRKNVHGQTDRGRKGFAMFFETHCDNCGHLQTSEPALPSTSRNSMNHSE